MCVKDGSDAMRRRNKTGWMHFNTSQINPLGFTLRNVQCEQFHGRRSAVGCRLGSGAWACHTQWGEVREGSYERARQFDVAVWCAVVRVRGIRCAERERTRECVSVCGQREGAVHLDRLDGSNRGFGCCKVQRDLASLPFISLSWPLRHNRDAFVPRS